MTSYLARRLILMIPTLLIITLTIFFLTHLMRGSALDIEISRLQDEDGGGYDVTEEERALIAESLGLDAPITVLYGRWLGGVLRGDLGTSMWKGIPVSQMLADRIPITVELGILSILMGVIISLPIGIYSAIRQDTVGDYLSRSFAIGLISTPGFWVAILLIVFGSLWWGWVPPLRFPSLSEEPIENLKFMWIPAIILGTHMQGGVMRITRTMMLEVLRQDYIRTAWSKGLKERVVVIRHALKNALIPVITVLGPQLMLLIGGTVIIEQIFMIPGMGRLFVEGIFQRDYPIISSVSLILSSVLLLINLGIDVSYAFLDPRIRYR